MPCVWNSTASPTPALKPWRSISADNLPPTRASSTANTPAFQFLSVATTSTSTAASPGFFASSAIFIRRGPSVWPAVARGALAAIALQVIEQRRPLLRRECGKSVAHDFALHAIDLELPHFEFERCRCEHAVTGGAALRIELGSRGIGLRQFGAARRRPDRYQCSEQQATAA